jgi:hypothetical protein
LTESRRSCTCLMQTARYGKLRTSRMDSRGPRSASRIVAIRGRF